MTWSSGLSYGHRSGPDWSRVDLSFGEALVEGEGVCRRVSALSTAMIEASYKADPMFTTHSVAGITQRSRQAA